MKVSDNNLLKLAIKFCRNFQAITPEAVLYGYSKLITMDERAVRGIVPDTNISEFEECFKWFEKNGIEPELVKTGISILSLYIPETEADKRTKKFASYLDEEFDDVSSFQILDKAKEISFLPLEEIFKKGGDITTVYAYKEKLLEDEKNRRKEKEPTPESDAAKIDDEMSDAPLGDIPQVDMSFEEMMRASRRRHARRKELCEIPDFMRKRCEKNPESDGEIETASEENALSGSEKFLQLSEKYKNLSASLLQVVKGQEHAVLKFVQGYNQGELLRKSEEGNHPRSYYFFFGPPGVGKTLLAETAAEALGMPHMIFNMSEYSAKQSHEGLIGVSKIYNTSQEGVLVQFVRENPECLLIFDEIEKAHVNVIRLFLQILGSGKLRNIYREEDTSFKDVTIIFTSNVGRDLYADRSVNLTTLPEKVLVDSIVKEKDSSNEPALPPEICSRIASGNTVLFNHLSIRHLVNLARDNFDRIVSGMESDYGITVTYAKELPLLFLYNRGGEIDARVAVGQSGKFMKNEIYEFMRQYENATDNEGKIKSIHIDIEWDFSDEELDRLFKNKEVLSVLAFSDNEKLFSAIDDSKYSIHLTSSVDEVREYLKNDISAVFVDPFIGKKSDTETVLSISDYNTDGVGLFHEIVEKQTGLPVFLMEVEKEFSDVDRKTFLQEGAYGSIKASPNQTQSFARQFTQIMEELYMENESQNFSQRGWVIDYNTKQEFDPETGVVRIVFYSLKKRRAVDVESRGSILADAERPNVKFDDIIGAQNAKEELAYFVKYLQNPRQFLASGGRAPKGVLLYGPPGTGKTMLAKAMAGESDVTFLQTSAADFRNKYAGEGEANIRRLFAKAKKYAPSIIFIDEIDSIGKKRRGEDNDGVESILTALFTEMDGFSSANAAKPVFVLAATNYGVGNSDGGIAALDDALIRRFDNKIYVDLPKESEREEFLRRVIEKSEAGISTNIIHSIAQRTTGQSLAILQNVIELAFRTAAKEMRKVNDDDLLTALEDYVYGEKKQYTPEYYKEVAVHELGHAYVSYLEGDKPSYITIESRGNFGGYMQHANQEDVPNYTKEDLIGKIRIALAGRAAESVFFGNENALNTGASSDLKHATDIAWQIICSYGMSDQLMVLDKESVLKSSLANDYIVKVNEILRAEMKNTIKIIEDGREKIKEMSEVLVRENRMTGEEFEKLMDS